MPLFDAYIFVDWSAANVAHPQQPTPNAVWSGEFIRHLNHQPETYYHRMRSDCVTYIKNILLNHVKEKRRVLVGFDFPYGFPNGFAGALGFPLDAQSWLRIWAELADRVTDTVNNENNRFIVAGELNAIAGDGRSGPFWGCPVGTDIANLQPRSPGFPFPANGGISLERLRLVETRLPGTKETWGLFGPGRVGGQALVGIPHLYKLRHHRDLVSVSKVWPFETGFSQSFSDMQSPSIIHAEIWPGIIEEKVQELQNNHPGFSIRDKAQVHAMCEWMAELDGQDALGPFFAQPDGLNSQQIQTCIEQEGWILGA